MIKAILLDVDDTILDFHQSSLQSILQAADKAGLELPEAFFPVFTRINVALWESYERGEIERQEIFERRWKEAFGEVGIEFDGILFEKLFRHNLRQCAVREPGAERLLKYLSERYPIYVASNTVIDQQVNRMIIADFHKYITAYFTSDNIGFAKPSREFFRYCLNHLKGIEADETVMIGDSLTADIAGARRCGIRTLWYDKYGKNVPDAADWRVTDLAEIEKIL
ncbi:MAG: HAD-IA family hydrolase [Erysipelotrichaceae bacterium]|nr:HAD-IA family hydrolase [Erysipelotrichaceae bacterium]MBQ4252544.1 HAD-IA family hydrolase [Erysipelotrichaceae bacterium]